MDSRTNWPLDQLDRMTESTDLIRMYSGGADTCIGVATAQLSDVLDYLRACPAPSLRKRPGMMLAE